MTAKPQGEFARNSSDKRKGKKALKALKDTIIAAIAVPLALVVIAGALAYLLAYLW